MLRKSVRKYIMNPCLGLLPFVLYLVFYRINEDISNSLIISLLFAAAGEIFLSIYSKGSRSGTMFVISFISLALSLIMWMLFNSHFIINYNLFLLLPEMFAVLIFTLTRIFRSFINENLLGKDNVVQKVFINEFFEVINLAQFFFSFHVFLVLIYKFLKDNELASSIYDNYIFIWMPIAGILALIIYENVKIKALIRKLKVEDWLPIVNEKGEVTGKIAKSVSIQMRNKFLHPVVRVALVYEGKLYLQERPPNDILDAGLLDHPFEKYMLFSHEINLAVRNSIVNSLGWELPFRFLLKYTFENEDTKRLIFLFASVIKDEKEIEEIEGVLKGRFWTPNQIDNDFGDDSKFSECFQMEYEYLKNTILAASNIESELSQTTNSN